MSEIVPLLTFKAGRCDGDTQGGKIKPSPTLGYVYVYVGLEDELVHFCWRSRATPAADAEMDLIMFPGDATFRPYTGQDVSADSDNVTSPTTGRVYVLKFSSSSQRHLFWLQSPSQHPDKQPNWFSPRDLKLGQIIDLLLSGEEVDVAQELSEIEFSNPDADNAGDGPGGNPRLRANSTGGAGSGATGGDIREEGAESREGGADGGRAPASSTNDASTLVQNLLASLGAPTSTAHSQPQQQTHPFCSLAHLLTPDTCIPIIATLPDTNLDALLAHLPPALLTLDLPSSSASSSAPDSEASAPAPLSTAAKRTLLTRVLRSAQLRQSLASLTAAIRDGGLPSVAEALGVRLAGGGLGRGGSVPLGGGRAVEAFVEGVRASVRREREREREGKMDVS